MTIKINFFVFNLNFTYSKLNFNMRNFNSPMVIDSNFLRKSYKMVASIKSDGMDYF